LRLASVLLVVVVAVAASAPRGHAQRYVAMPDTAFPRVKYADSLVSINDRCMVRQTKLAPRMRPIYVSGQPVGFC